MPNQRPVAVRVLSGLVALAGIVLVLTASPKAQAASFAGAAALAQTGPADVATALNGAAAVVDATQADALPVPAGAVPDSGGAAPPAGEAASGGLPAMPVPAASDVAASRLPNATSPAPPASSPAPHGPSSTPPVVMRPAPVVAKDAPPPTPARHDPGSGVRAGGLPAATGTASLALGVAVGLSRPLILPVTPAASSGAAATGDGNPAPVPTSLPLAPGGLGSVALSGILGVASLSPPAVTAPAGVVPTSSAPAPGGEGGSWCGGAMAPWPAAPGVTRGCGAGWPLGVSPASTGLVDPAGILSLVVTTVPGVSPRTPGTSGSGPATLTAFPPGLRNVLLGLFGGFGPSASMLLTPRAGPVAGVRGARPGPVGFPLGGGGSAALAMQATSATAQRARTLSRRHAHRLPASSADADPPLLSSPLAAGGAAAAGTGTGLGATPMLLLAALALWLLSLLPGRVSLELLAWRSTLFALRLERPG